MSENQTHAGTLGSQRRAVGSTGTDLAVEAAARWEGATAEGPAHGGVLTVETLKLELNTSFSTTLSESQRSEYEKVLKKEVGAQLEFKYDPMGITLTFPKGTIFAFGWHESSW